MRVGEKKVLKLKFPENYTPELKGKDVEFSVTVREIKERIEPEMNKEFFEDLGIEVDEDDIRILTQKLGKTGFINAIKSTM